MTPERWREVKTLFDRALEWPASERSARLAVEKGRDQGLVAEVERLLQANAAAGDFLEKPAIEEFSFSSESAVIPARVGPYEIERELGQGGMGTVYLATRSTQGFRQTVALKLVRRGMDSEFILERFRGERRILAELDHPYIARLLDGGTAEDGLPYFVMEYVAGRHLLEDCDARGLPTHERLVLFRQICDAAAYAHRHLVVHRDLKPSNILVTPEGVPKLLDFGLAKLLSPELAGEGPARTQTVVRLLTPDYASPEQVRGERVTTATDIYSLGVVLYELLTGSRPYRVTGRSAEAIARAVCEEEPPKPSAKVASLRGDLDNIVLMALRKEPERRYASVEQLSEDIRLHLAGLPVRARKDTFGYRAGKFVGRHRAGTIAAALGALLLAGATVTAVHQARVAQAERVAAEERFGEVRALANSFLFEFHDAIKDLPGATPARQLVVRRALEYLEKLSRVRSDDPTLQRELAEDYERVAMVQGGLFESHLGDTRGARQSLLRALAVRETLVEANPSSRADRAALAETELGLSQVLMVAHEIASAERAARRAESILEGLGRESPGDAVLNARLARARRYRGTALTYAGDREAASRTLRSAAATFSNLVRAEPENRAYRRELAITLQQLLFALPVAGERTEADESYRQASQIQDALVASEPSSFQLRRELAYTHSSMGDFLDRAGDHPGALACYERAEKILDDLVVLDPRNADARLHLAETLNNVGYLACVEGDPVSALKSLRRSLPLFREITASDPANVRALVGLARACESMGTAIAAAADKGLGDAEEAREWYRRSRQAYLSLQSRGLLDRSTGAELEAVSKKHTAGGSARD
jgi:tetratricopeptide (TPR) repeat protein